MITVQYDLNNLFVSGHADFDTKGKDLVCAGISGIVLGAATWFNKKDASISIDKKKNCIKFKLKDKSKYNQLKLALIVKQIKPWSKKYNKYIKIVKKGA